MRPIDADAACETMYREPYLTESAQAAYRAFIRSQPTIDAVLVVRCKDCAKHYVVNGRDMCARNAQGSRDHWIGLTATQPDAFCSRGERKGADG